ncbi:hypothetical protein [Streptomyces halobius]|uniref:Uncharacterized protein n=1 Tax=Streptomyces halobius TaxID=2879846 RepID=A0ABY4M0X6_9ACTN|nr:hypothetical protein [Streptomyces halobius]UQA90793.1 hypothetical protein K9S39_01835 [Streptomyces halobius]
MGEFGGRAQLLSELTGRTTRFEQGGASRLITSRETCAVVTRLRRVVFGVRSGPAPCDLDVFEAVARYHTHRHQLTGDESEQTEALTLALILHQRAPARVPDGVAAYLELIAKLMPVPAERLLEGLAAQERLGPQRGMGNGR